MTKARIPVTFPNAITRIAGLITFEDAAQIVGRSDRCVRDWSDPLSSALPALDQALALDAAYRAAGGEGAPIAETYAAMLDAQLAAETACCAALTEDIARAASEFGDAVAAGLAVTGEGCGTITIRVAMQEAEQAHSATGAMLRRLHSFLPGGAGLRGGKTGGVPK